MKSVLTAWKKIKSELIEEFTDEETGICPIVVSICGDYRNYLVGENPKTFPMVLISCSGYGPDDLVNNYFKSAPGKIYFEVNFITYDTEDCIESLFDYMESAYDKLHGNALEITAASSLEWVNTDILQPAQGFVGYTQKYSIRFINN